MSRNKYIILFFILLFGRELFPQLKVESYSQSGSNISFELSLNPLHKTSSVNTSGQNIISFGNYYDESHPGNYALPSREIFIALPSFSRAEINVIPLAENRIEGVPAINPSVSLLNDSTLEYQKTEHLLNKNYSAGSLFKVRGYLWIRDYYCVALQLNQYRFNGADIINELKKVKINIKINDPGESLTDNDRTKDKLFSKELNELIVNYADAAPLNKTFYTAKNIDFNDSWINFNNTYLKIGVARDGIYRISKSDLVNYGVAVDQIDPKTFKLFLRGKEQPIYVYGENDGRFDAGDYVEFFGSRNWGDNYRQTSSGNESYKEYLNRYSDTTVYWLTWNDGNGLRADTVSSFSGTPADTLQYYSEIVHYEENPFLDYSVSDLVTRQDPDWLPNETWVWAQQGVGTVDRTFTVHDVYPGKNAQAYFKVQSYASNGFYGAHKIGLSINSDPTVYDSTAFNKYQQRVVKANFSSDLLTEGNNTLKTISFRTNATLNSVEYDWYEVEYPRYLKAIGDSLKILFDDIPFPGLKTIKITNVSSGDIVIYKYADQLKKITNYLRSRGDIFFNDTVRSGDKYILISSSKITSPEIYYKKTFTDLASASNQADYILITAPEFISKANEYTQFIQQNYNVTTKVVNVNDIYDQFNYGFFAPEPIRTFLQAANLNWQFPKPSYLFIVGDANYDYYGNTHKYFGSPVVKNYVPSYGDPVSDNWFVDWDSSKTLIQQMYVGRIPVSTTAEFDHYFNKHKRYLTDPYDLFNKTYLLISSGDINNAGELSLLKSANDIVQNNVIQPPPIGGLVNHLYKTQNPVSNFGPYTEQQVSKFIGDGGLFISYIGHSGTQIWDNGINTIEQLKNNSGKGSLISDWGCSTGKFAEPDIKSFSELFINQPDGQAIGYTGNTSLGFTSTAVVFPKLFYSELLLKNAESIGMAHSIAKNELLQNYGQSGVYRIFALCNILLGDPIVRLKVPPKPNLKISADDLVVQSANPDDSQDSIKLKIYFYNLGKVDTTKFNISVTDNLNNQEVFNKIFTRSIPSYKDSVDFYLPVKKLAGDHKLKVLLDAGNSVDEISKNDNTAQFDIFIPNSSVKALVSSPTNLISNGNFVFINPLKNNISDSINVQYADNAAFNNSDFVIKKLDTLATSISIKNLVEGKRYWIRSKLNSSAQQYGSEFSFIYNSQPSAKFSLSDSLSFASSQMKNVAFANDEIKLSKTRNELKMQTAGYYDGTYAIVTVNGLDYVASSNAGGHHILVFDEKTLKFEGETYLNYYNDTQNFESRYIAALDAIPNNKIIAIATNDDPSGGMTTAIKDKLKAMGSTKIDSVVFRSTWGIITMKNYTAGHVLEGYSKPFQGPVVLDTIITSSVSNGNLVTEQIGPSSNWKSISLTAQVPANSSMNIIPIGIQSSGSVDSLSAIAVTGNSINLSGISAIKYPYLKFKINFSSADSSSLPSLKTFNVDYNGEPELGTNYQLVSIDKDSVVVGGNLRLQFSVMNVGESAADSFNVKVDLVNQDNSKTEIFQNAVSSLLPGGRKTFQVDYNALTTGAQSFLITVDPENKIPELFKDNNFYSVPFFVKSDTNKPKVNLTFDGREIVDNDFVSSHPKIKIELNDPSLLPVTDTSAVSIKLDGRQIFYSGNSSILTYRFNSTNPKMVVDYSPALNDGNYSIAISSKNSLGNKSSDVTKDFTVSSEPKILDLYNYPNPFRSETYFTFKLAQIPDELRIKIFTVAGRMIREFTLRPSDLNYDFNRIYWDGRDQDGDVIANGVYLYKVIMTSGGKTQSLTQKLAVVR